MYPTISEYLEAIKVAENNFDQLKHLRPALGEDEETKTILKKYPYPILADVTSGI